MFKRLNLYGLTVFSFSKIYNQTMSQLTQNQTITVKQIATLFHNYSYAVRGTASLVLQNIEMGVDDIDLISDAKSALKANELLKDFIIDSVAYKESPKFKSYFGKFLVNEVQVEVMGEWQIKDKNGNWSEVFDGSSFNEVEVDGIKVRVTKIEDELKMFLLMQRFSAYQKIKKQLKPMPDLKHPTLF